MHTRSSSRAGADATNSTGTPLTDSRLAAVHHSNRRHAADLLAPHVLRQIAFHHQPLSCANTQIRRPARASTPREFAGAVQFQEEPDRVGAWVGAGAAVDLPDAVPVRVDVGAAVGVGGVAFRPPAGK